MRQQSFCKRKDLFNGKWLVDWIMPDTGKEETFTFETKSQADEFVYKSDDNPLLPIAMREQGIGVLQYV